MILLKFFTNFAIFLVPAALLSIGAWSLSKSSHEEWKVLAWVPVLPLAIWAPWIAWDVTRDPTSHNLWPFEVVIWGILSAGLFAAFVIARRIFGQPRSDWSTRGGRTRP